MRILVTGTEGQLARSLVERAAGHPDLELIAIGRPELDLEQEGSAASAIAQAAPDIVINAAAYTAVDQAEDEPERALRINADAAGEVAAAAAGVGAAVIQLSTDYVFDGTGSGAYREDAPVNPLGVYGRSKLAGEEQVRAANPRHAIVRTAWVYSPFNANFVKTMLRLAEARDEVSVVADQQGNPTSALDIADTVIEVLTKLSASSDQQLGGVFHMTGQGDTTWAEFAAAIFSASADHNGPHARVRPITTSEYPTKAQRPANSRLDSRKLARTYGVRLPPWRESLERVVVRLLQPQA